MPSESPVHDYITIAWRRKWLLIAPTIVGLTISALLLGKLPRIYEAIAKVTEERQEVQLDGGRRGNSEAARMALVRLQLSDFAEPVARKVYNVPQGDPLDEHRVSRVKNSLTLDTYGDLIYFKSRDLDPEFVARVANFYAEEFVDWTIDRAKGRAGKEALFFEKQKREKEAELKAKDEEISRFKEAHRGSLPDDMVLHSETIERLRDDLAQAKADLNSRIDERNQFISALQITSSQPVESATAGAPRTASEPESKLKQLEAQLANLRLRLTEKHPDVQEKLREIRELKAQMAAVPPEEPPRSAQRSAPAEGDDESQLSPGKIGMISYTQLMQMNRDVNRLRQRIASLESDIGKHQAAIGGAGRVSAEWDSLTRERAALNEQYQSLFSQAAKAERDVDYTETKGEKFRLQQPAEIPLSPISPVPLKVLGLGLGAGLAAGIGLALLAEMMDQTYKTVEEISKDIDVPVVATISRIETVRKVARIENYKQKAG